MRISKIETGRRCSRGLCSGFTLLEIMVAVAILAIVLSAVLRLHLQSIAMAQEARFHAVAPLLAQQKLAQIQGRGWDIDGSGQGDFDGEFSQYAWTATVETIAAEEPADVMENMKRVEVTITLNQDERRYALRRYVFQHQP